MSLFIGLLFGAVGGVYMAYGKRQSDALYLVTGFVLIIYPYFISNILLMIVVGIVIALVPLARARGWF